LRAQVEPFWAARCASLKSAGLVTGDTLQAQAASAYQQMRAKGWTDAALTAGALSTGFDLWRAIAVTYASSYGRFGVGEHPCGFSYAAQNPDFSPRVATAAERAAWWADGSGIPPGAGVGLIDSKLSAPDFTFNGLQCLRALNTGTDEAAQRVQQGIAQVRAGLPRKGLPVIVVHGRDDGLIPPAFTSDPYVAQAKAAGSSLAYWQVQHAQHFDGFLALPAYGARYVPLLPYVYAALDRVSAQLDGQGAARDLDIAAQPRGAGAVSVEQLQLPR
jgi:hydroxybutyrate-dimer hydrolase